MMELETIGIEVYTLNTTGFKGVYETHSRYLTSSDSECLFRTTPSAGPGLSCEVSLS